MDTVLKPLNIKDNLEPGTIIRRIGNGKDQQGSFLEFDENYNMILANIIDMQSGHLVANEAVLKPQQNEIIVTADHGGHEDFHGTWLPEDMTIPWAVIGPGVIPQYPDAAGQCDRHRCHCCLGAEFPALPDAAGLPIVEAFGQTSPPRADPRCP